MFMNEGAFDDDAPSRNKGRKASPREDDGVSDAVETLTLEDKRPARSAGVSSAHPNSLKDDEDLDAMVDGDDYLSGSRSNVIQQQRDLHKKKLQERMGGGVVRTSLPKQYSAPRSLDIDEKPSRFGHDDDDDDSPRGGRRAGGSRNGSSSRANDSVSSYSRRAADDDEDDDDRSYRRGVSASRDRDGGRGSGRDDRERDRGVTTRGAPADRDRDRDRDDRDDWRKDRDRDRDYGRDRDRERDRDRDRERDRDRGRDRDRNRDWDKDDEERDRDRDRYRGENSKSRSAPRSDSREKDDYSDRRRSSKDYGGSARNEKPSKRSGGRGDRDDDDEDDKRGSGGRGGKSSNARNRSRSQSRSGSRSRSRSRSASADYSSGDDNAATSHDPSSTSKPRTTPAVKKPKLDITDMRAFIMRPIPKAYDVVECYIERNKSGANKMFPEYCLYMKEGDRFLLTAKKRPKNRTSNYLISMQRGDLMRRGSDNYVGKLRANFLGTEFTVYDNGSNPKDADQQTITSNPAGIRQELGICMYAANVLGHRGPRKMKVCVPRVREDGTRVVWRPLGKDDEMINKCKEQDHTNLTYLINKPPRWNDQVCAYVLNFNGRVTMASVKNFQLVTPEDQETVVLQFGRVGKDLFTMDFRWPLCPMQAFAITLSSFDSKLACE